MSYRSASTASTSNADGRTAARHKSAASWYAGSVPTRLSTESWTCVIRCNILRDLWTHQYGHGRTSRTYRQVEIAGEDKGKGRDPASSPLTNLAHTHVDVTYRNGSDGRHERV